MNILGENYKNTYRELYDITGRKPETSLSSSTTIDNIDNFYKIKKILTSKQFMLVVGIFLTICFLLTYTEFFVMIEDEEGFKKLSYKKLIMYSTIITSVIYGAFRFNF